MWEELYKELSPELRRYACAACHNAAEAEDVAQEVFLRALQTGDIFLDLGPSQQRAWLYRAMKNLLCDRYRRGRLEDAYLDTRVEESAAYEERGIQEAENRLFLAALPPEDRALFHLRYEEGYTAPELAEMLGIPSGTVRARLCRMRKVLKSMLE